ncbi:MAG TPA: uroporphyrinogen decarboxylase family protein [Armatimonadota bacterium]|nr:uroporphyrinogen decarboxylase family protein [Armatimonadota bacterium]
MAKDMEQLYSERLARYVTAMRNGKPDCVPIRPFVAEFCAKYAGYTAQQVTHDYALAFDAAVKTATDFDWDAVVGNMVYVWTGLTQAIGTEYYAVPGIDLPENTGFQYREPGEDAAYMGPDEYDALIEDPTGFLMNVWLPRISTDVVGIGEASTMRNNLSFLKGGMAMMEYFAAFGAQAVRLQEEAGMPGAIAGILKAPLDIIADKLRGYIGLTMDLLSQPEKVLAACEALAPHLCNVALSGADPTGNAPVTIWMHRGCVPFVTPEQFSTYYWPTLKPIILELWNQGIQTLFYAEGNWNHHLDAFAELPEGSIIYHVDQADIFEVHEKLGDRFCLSGGIPNFLLSYGTPEQVCEHAKKIIDGVAQDGGYIMDASAIMQDDTNTENLRALTDFTREYGQYGGPTETVERGQGTGETPEWRETKRAPGAVIPWAEKLAELPKIQGDADIVKRVWEDVDALAYMYIWQCLESF